MKQPSRSMIPALGLGAWALVVSVTAGATHPRQDPQQPAAPQEDPVTLFNRMCSDCHDADRIVAPRRTKAEWEEVIREMIVEGATGSEQDFQRVFEYLLITYGKLYVNTATADEMRLTLGLSKQEAEALLAYRTKAGPFADLDALKKAPGIDVKKVDEHKDAIVF
jgi:competence ComEA-like helix-hairpin-helix protein